MAQPRLLHPLWCVIEPLDASSQIEDENMREEIQIVGRSPRISIPAQLEYRDKGRNAIASESFDARGLVSHEGGYFLVRVLDTQLRGWTPSIGDRLVEIGTGTTFPQQMNSIVFKISPRAHYPGLGATLLKCHFMDRAPSHG